MCKIQIVETHVLRDRSLQHCLCSTTDKLQKLRDQKTSNPNDLQLQKHIKREQIKVTERFFGGMRKLCCAS